MRQFVRIQQGNAVIPGLVSDAGLPDLRSLVSDITPETIASGVPTNVNATPLKPLSGEVRYLAPISGIRQIPATGFNYKKHIEEMKVPAPTEPEVFLKSMLSLTGPFDPVSRGPNAGVKLDWKTELAIVVAREVQDITAGTPEYQTTRRKTQREKHMIRTNVCMKLLTTILLTVATAFAQPSDRLPVTDAEKIADALRAAPAFITEDATLLDWPAAPGGEYRVLRKGSNEWTCLPGIPAYHHDEPGCFDAVFLQ
jgi:hypothetical protein